MRIFNRSAVVAGTSLVAASLVAGCGDSSDLDEQCAAAFERAALTVDQVVSAEYECGGSFGAPSQDGTIVMSVETQEQATLVIEEIYKAFAFESALDDAWIPGTQFLADEGGASFDDLDLGFNGGTPPVGDMRDRYDIHPPGAD